MIKVLTVATVALGAFAFAAARGEESYVKEGVTYQTFETKHVPSGRTRNIIFLLGASAADCVPWNPDEMEIRTVKPPEHGMIEFTDGHAISNFTQPHLSHCSDKRMPGKWVTYTSNKGYVGPDEFVLFEMYPGGATYEARYRVMVH
jgi:hypothetical protein